MQTWDFLELAVKSYDFKNVQQIVLTLSKKEAVNSTPTECVDYKGYFTVLYKLEKLGFKKWFVKNSQSGMYDSPRTGERLTNTYIVHYGRI